MLLEIGVREDNRHSGWQCQKGSATGKRRVLGGVFLLEMALRSLKTAKGSERGYRLEQMACQVADLALEMTED